MDLVLKFKLNLTSVVPTLRSMLIDSLDGAVKFSGLYDSMYQSYWIPTVYTNSTGTVHPNLIRLIAGIRNQNGKKIIEPSNQGLLSYGKRSSPYHGEILNPDAPCKTIICSYKNCPRLFVGLIDTTGQRWLRCLLIHELIKIQGFPRNYKFFGSHSDIITQVGNAVPPAIVTNIVNQFESVKFSIVRFGGDLSETESDNDNEHEI